jgi:hypothetical protein
VPKLICNIAVVFALVQGSAYAAEDFERVNRLRAQAGLPTFEHHAALQAAAARHAAYLDRHREPGRSPHGSSAHRQRQEMEGFSGEMPGDRALAAGYPHREVLENLSMGYSDAQSAIDGLMAAIYHRLTFLDLESDQLGIATGVRSRVFLLGRSDVSMLCEEAPQEALYRTPVDCLGQPMKRAYYDSLCARLPDQALFRPAHPVSCPNGTRLDAAFMADVCGQPVPEARFRGHGRYYLPCENGTEIDADWFDALCERPPTAAVYPASGRYYELCEPRRRVYAEWFEARCATLPADAVYRDSWRYRRPCGDGPDVRVEYLDQLDAARQRPLPDTVVWPPAGGVQVPPAFFVEEPDPLPDLEVAGYPVSIQFNPARAGEVQLRDFRLFRVDGETDVPIEQVRLLDQASDPNGLLTAHEFALFPLERLDWGARYRAVVDGIVDGRSRRYAWSFETLGGDTPLLSAPAERQRFVVQSGVDYLLYLPPSEDGPHTVLRTRVEHRRGNRLELKVVDPNTLRIRVEARRCDLMRLGFDDGRRVELIPAGCSG